MKSKESAKTSSSMEEKQSGYKNITSSLHRKKLSKDMRKQRQWKICLYIAKYNLAI